MATLTTVRNDVLAASADFAQDSQPADGQGNGGSVDHDGGPVASVGDNDGGRGACHGYGDHPGDLEARPVPSFWNFVESEIEHSQEHANNNHHQFDLKWHHA